MSPFDQDVRLLILPGLHGSGPDHWQSWLEASYPGAVRLAMTDWSLADADHWAAHIDLTLAQHRAGGWIAVAHSFGCLALARYAARGGRAVQGALMVAPANPDRFQIDERLVDAALPFPSTLVTSENDPWMSSADAQYFGMRWGSQIVGAGEAGHINPAAGYGPWPLGRQLVEKHVQRVTTSLPRRPRERAASMTLGFAV